MMKPHQSDTEELYQVRTLLLYGTVLYVQAGGFHHRMLRARLRYDLVARGRDGWGPLGTAGDRWGPLGTAGDRWGSLGTAGDAGDESFVTEFTYGKFIN